MNQEEYEVHPSIMAEMQQAASLSQQVSPQHVEQPESNPVQVAQPSPQPQPDVYHEPEIPVQRNEQPHEINYRKLRYELDQARREKEEAYRMLESERSKPQQIQQMQQNYDINVGDDDIVEGKHLKSYVQKIQKQQQDLVEEQKRSNTIMLEAKLRSEMPDIEKVVNSETIESLRALYPEIAQSIGSSGNIYTQGKSAYQMIKSLGLYKEDKYEDDRARAQTNAHKPRPLTSVSPQQGDSPLSHANAFANGLTEDLKKSLFKEMMDARRKN